MFTELCSRPCLFPPKNKKQTGGKFGNSHFARPVDAICTRKMQYVFLCVCDLSVIGPSHGWLVRPGAPFRLSTRPIARSVPSSRCHGRPVRTSSDALELCTGGTFFGSPIGVFLRSETATGKTERPSFVRDTTRLRLDTCLQMPSSMRLHERRSKTWLVNGWNAISAFGASEWV